MCFIKTVYQLPKHPKSLIDIEQFSQSSLQQCEKHETLSNSMKNFNFGFENHLVNNFPQSFMLLQLAGRLQKNQQQMSFIHETIDQCEETLEEMLLDLSEQSFSDHSPVTKKHLDIQTLESISDLQHSLFSSIKEQTSSNILTGQLFGESKKYRYRLQCIGDFESIIYKERNIKLDVQLKTLDGKSVKNCKFFINTFIANIVNLCFALADDNGNWVPMNRVGDPMLKGKTEVQLYHGSAEFNKIYTRDISRTFPNGRLNIVVYAKPSMLIYDGLSTEFEEHIDVEMIEPLVIEDVVIKAKKKY